MVNDQTGQDTLHPKVLVIDDEEVLARNIATYLQRQGMEVDVTHNGVDGLMRVSDFNPQLVLLDYNLPDMNGLEIMKRILAVRPRTRVIMMTGQGSETVAVCALKSGASDYVCKPMQLSALRLAINTVLKRRRPEDWPRAMREAANVRAMDTMERRRSSDRLDAQTTSWKGKLVLEPSSARNERPVAPVISDNGLSTLVGKSVPMQTLKTLINRIVDADPGPSLRDPPSVLICGETGTGKELVARALHYEGSRRDGPFVEINCAGIPTTLLEAELFGHERGAFTDARKDKAGLIESAEGGTMFLDEIGDLDLVSQAKLLKVIEERKLRRLGSLKDIPVNTRFVAATSRDLEKLVRDGLFRADLYYRLRMIRVNVPALRERRGDVMLLASHFLGAAAVRYGKPGIRLGSESFALLDQHTWPGNVRELRNVIEQGIVLADGETIAPEELCLEKLQVGGTNAIEASDPNDLKARLAAVADLPLEEQEVLSTALKTTQFNISKAARVLGLSRDTLRYRLKKYNISI